MGFERSYKTKDVLYVLHKDKDDKYNFKKQSFWRGFEFREARKGAKAKSYSELKDDTEFRKYFCN